VLLKLPVPVVVLAAVEIAALPELSVPLLGLVGTTVTTTPSAPDEVPAVGPVTVDGTTVTVSPPGPDAVPATGPVTV
jgi:hypothetical protein